MNAIFLCLASVQVKYNIITINQKKNRSYDHRKLCRKLRGRERFQRNTWKTKHFTFSECIYSRSREANEENERTNTLNLKLEISERSVIKEYTTQSGTAQFESDTKWRIFFFCGFFHFFVLYFRIMQVLQWVFNFDVRVQKIKSFLKKKE